MFRFKLMFLAVVAHLFNANAISKQEPQIESRIVNGKNADRGQFPFYAFLELHYADRATICGGSLISDKWVLTAAHCVATAPLALTISLGSLRSYDYEEYGRENIVIKPPTSMSDHIYVHPKYMSLIIMK